MPNVQAGDLSVYYETTGAGEPLVLIPYLAADQACYAFQVGEYAKHFTCISVDLRGAGQSDKPAGSIHDRAASPTTSRRSCRRSASTARMSWDCRSARATGMWLAAKYPEKVKTLSLHSAWPKTDLFLRTVVETWQVMARQLDSMPDLIIKGIFPWCFTPELYAEKPEYITALADFVRSRPVQPRRRLHAADAER